MTNKLPVLQLCGFSDYLEQELDKRFERIVWHLLSAVDQEKAITALGNQPIAVATGGHLGCTDTLMDRLPGLGLIAINGVGFDKVNLDHARSRGIRVSTTPDVLTDDVADLAVGLIIGLLRELPQGDQHVRTGQWPKGEVRLARRVSGKRFGIVGLGRIGSAIAARLAPFGPVAYTDLQEKEGPYSFFADLHSLARNVDVLILASAANNSNKGLIGSSVLTALGKSGYLVNVARGSLIDEDALIMALKDGTIAGAALDVFAAEPNVPDALIDCNTTMLTPHIASATVETRCAMADLVIANIDAFAKGQPLPTPIF